MQEYLKGLQLSMEPQKNSYLESLKASMQTTSPSSIDFNVLRQSLGGVAEAVGTLDTPVGRFAKTVAPAIKTGETLPIKEAAKAALPKGFSKMTSEEQLGDAQAIGLTRPTALFHGTSKLAAESIKSSGFDLAAKKSSELKGLPKNYGDAVYLSRSKDSATKYSTGEAVGRHVYEDIVDTVNKIKTGDYDELNWLYNNPYFKKASKKVKFDVYGEKMTLQDLLDNGAEPEDLVKEMRTIAKETLKMFQREGDVLEVGLSNTAKIKTVKDSQEYRSLVESAGGKNKLQKFLVGQGFDGVHDLMNDDFAIFNTSAIKLKDGLSKSQGNIQAQIIQIGEDLKNKAITEQEAMSQIEKLQEKFKKQ